MAYTVLRPDWGPSRPVEGVLFDMDGLVLDTEKLYARFWQEGAQSLGFPMTREQALGMRALNHQAGEAKLKSYFGPDTPYPEIRAARIRLMNAYIEVHGVEPKPGIRELLAYLKGRGIPAAIATASPLELVNKYLGSLDLLKGFQALCSVREVAMGKPEPDIFLLAARRIGKAPENCMVLEDSPSGLLAGKRAGCFPVMVPDLDQPNEETRALLTAKADSLLDVIDLLESIS